MAAAAVSFAALVAVAGSVSAGATVQAQKTEADLSLTVAISSGEVTPIPNGELQLGVSSGYYASHGLNVQIDELSGDAQAVDALVAGDAEVADVDTSSAIQLKAQGLADIEAIDSVGVAPDYVLVATNNITSLSGLEGQTVVGEGNGDQANFMLTYLLAKNKISPTSVNFVNVGSAPARLTALVNREGVATVDSEAQWLALSPQQQSGLHLLCNQTCFVDQVPYQSKVNVATTSTIKQDKVALQRFVTDNMELARIYYKSPTTFAQAVAAQRPDLSYSSIYDTAILEGFRKQWCVNGCLNFNELATTSSLLYNDGALPGVPSIKVSEWATSTFVTAALKQVGVYKGLDKV
jgi:ABC-type nitrate/sulfonate/bicarbonate transport system substrate-binding protein